MTAAQLPVLRPQRYEGGDLSISLTELQAEDQALLASLYQDVRRIYDVSLYMGTTPDFSIYQALLPTLLQLGSQVRRLGQASQPCSTMVSRALHDVRAGGLAALLGYIEMLHEEGEEFSRQDVERCIGLARDHAKLMRNCVEDLDPWIRRADERISLHTVQSDAHKWAETRLRVDGRSLSVQCDLCCEGYISNRCLETSSVDRILFNLMNNAARFCAGEVIEMRVDSLEDKLVRWSISNPVSPDQAQWLKAEVGSDLSRLFLGGVTHGGQGVGLSNCANLVKLSFGLKNVEQALQAGYLGATLHVDRFYSWFCWPLYHPQEGDVVCAC